MRKFSMHTRHLHSIWLQTCSYLRFGLISETVQVSMNGELAVPTGGEIGVTNVGLRVRVSQLRCCSYRANSPVLHAEEIVSW